MREPYASISIVCVYNDLAVRQQCLDRSIKELAAEADDVEYLPIDNVHSAFSSAGAALNHGVSQAVNDVIVFAHQDVYLHSLTALKKAAGQLAASGFGLLGAAGIQADGQIVGHIRDRVVLLGAELPGPAEADSVDEVLFLASREQLLREPLTESPDLAWHAYGVEYGLRVRSRGLRVGVADIPLTHNSLSVNLARLAEAHRAVAETYPSLLPVRTTCGVVDHRTGPTSRRVLLPAHRWRYTWLRESLALRRAAAGAGARPGTTVLADIRMDVDDVIAVAPERRLHIISASPGGRFADGGGPGDGDGRPEQLAGFELRRRDGTVTLTSCDPSRIPDALAAGQPGSWQLVTNLSRQDVHALAARLDGTPVVLGLHTNIGFWLLAGAERAALPAQWRTHRATPLGVRALAPSAS